VSAKTAEGDGSASAHAGDRTRGNVGETIYAEVTRLIAGGGMSKRDAFAQVAEAQGRQAGTVSASYYRIARQRGEGRVGAHRVHRLRRPTGAHCAGARTRISSCGLPRPSAAVIRRQPRYDLSPPRRPLTGLRSARPCSDDERTPHPDHDPLTGLRHRRATRLRSPPGAAPTTTSVARLATGHARLRKRPRMPQPLPQRTRRISRRGRSRRCSFARLWEATARHARRRPDVQSGTSHTLGQCESDRDRVGEIPTGRFHHEHRCPFSALERDEAAVRLSSQRAHRVR